MNKKHVLEKEICPYCGKGNVVIENNIVSCTKCICIDTDRSLHLMMYKELLKEEK
jgi:hypothetical protein